MRTEILFSLAVAGMHGACWSPTADGLRHDSTSSRGSDLPRPIQQRLDEQGPSGRASTSPNGSAAPGAPAPTLDEDGTTPTGPGGATAGPDADGDGVPDALDCDPASPNVGPKLVDDDLATATGLVQPAPGFDASAWTHSAGAYRQQVLRDGADASLFTISAPSPPDAYRVEVHVSATQLGSFRPKLRQQMLVVGGSAAGGGFSGFGCGVEAVEGATPEWKTSLVHLAGSVTAVATDPIRREDATAVTVGADIAIAVVVAGGSITCTVTQGTNSVTLAAPGTAAVGSIGLYTRQMKSAFSKARVCQVRS